MEASDRKTANGAEDDTPALGRIDLATGSWLEVREPTPDDIGGLHDLYDGLSLDDLYRRFFSIYRPSDAQLRSWVSRSRAQGRRLIACRESGAVVADGGYVRQDDGDAELDLVVAREARGWLGAYLLDRLIDLAREDGVPNLRAEVLFQNRSMLALLHHRPYANLSDDEHTILHLLIAVSAETPVWPADHHRPRILIEGGGLGWVPLGLSESLGVDVVQCPGPHAGAPCPALTGRTCPLVDGADAVVCALRGARDRDSLLSGHHLHRPDQRLFATTPTHAGHAEVLDGRQPALTTVARALDLIPDDLPRRSR